MPRHLSILLFVTFLVLAVGCSDQPTAPVVDSPAAPTLSAAGANVSGASGSVTGSAHLQVFGAPGLGLRRLTYHAVRLPDGSISGGWNLVAGASILHGDIDCLHIAADGRSARMSGVVTDAKFTTFQIGTAFAIEVVDNGNGRSGEADQTSGLRAFRNAPPEVGRLFCETGEAPSDVELMSIEKGNTTIHLLSAD